MSTAQAVSAPVILPVLWSSLRRMGSLSSPDGLCEQRMQHPGSSVAGRSDVGGGVRLESGPSSTSAA